MNPGVSTNPPVLLIAANLDGLAALRPTREMLSLFGLAWKEKLAANGGESFNPEGARALVVASPDAILPAALAATTALPTVRVPVADAGRGGVALLDDLVADGPGGVAAFATVAIGEAGAKNAALFVVSMLGLMDALLWEKWLAFRQQQTDAVLGLPPLPMS